MSATIEYRRVRRGVTVHAVVAGERAAVCGYDCRRAGWAPELCPAPTCPACRRKLGVGPLPAPRAASAAEAMADAARRRQAAKGGSARDNVLGLISDLADALDDDGPDEPPGVGEPHPWTTTAPRAEGGAR